MLLINKHQEQICDKLLDHIQQFVQLCPKSMTSTTFVPYYDRSIIEKQKSLLQEVAINKLIEGKVEKQQINISAVDDGDSNNARMQDQSLNTLIKYRIKKDQPSTILSDYQISNLAATMLPMYRNLEWNLLYRLSENGSSMITFQKRCEKDAMTLLLVKDDKGYKFGSLQFEDWRSGIRCFGTGESTIFTFQDGNECRTWQGAGNN